MPNKKQSKPSGARKIISPDFFKILEERCSSPVESTERVLHDWASYGYDADPVSIESDQSDLCSTPLRKFVGFICSQIKECAVESSASSNHTNFSDLSN